MILQFALRDPGSDIKLGHVRPWAIVPSYARRGPLQRPGNPVSVALNSACLPARLSTYLPSSFEYRYTDRYARAKTWLKADLIAGVIKESVRNPGDENAAYLDKYRPGIERLVSTLYSFARDYSVPIRVEPIKVQGH